MKHQYYCQVGQDRMCVLCGKMDYEEGPDQWQCPGTGAHMKIGHFGGIKPGDIVQSADIYESNWGETIAEAKNWFPNGVVKNRPGFVTKVAYDELMAHENALRDEICKLKENGRARHDYAKAKLLQEIARLKARIRALEPEQPQPRPLYRWGRPV